MSERAFSLLPDDVRPLKYRITIRPNLKSFTFSGEETIDIEVRKPTSQIVLNAAELEIQEAHLIHEKTIKAEEIRIDEDSETLRLRFYSPIPRGPMQLYLRFTGQLNDRLRGFYRSEYTLSDGTKRIMATTQFEAADARRAFPCWDEPERKAKFEVSGVIPAELTAVSNMPVIRETPHPSGGKVVEFAESPIMSTYLLALIVGEFESIEDQAGKTLVRVWTTPGKENQGRFALDVARKILPFYESYFGVPYPLPKLDLIAIPDFAAGAMENWGAVTFREVALLVDPANSSVATKQRVAVTIAHEIAHMWFGNLVTMQWWNDLWLNEGFASWIQHKAVDYLFPEWEMWNQFVHASLGSALSLDGLKNSHPIEVEVKNPNEISELFDAISYRKGASVIRMLEQYLGEETFRRGLARYFSKHAYGNARTEDLWSALEKISRKSVKAIMDTWTKQTGYPLLKVEEKKSVNDRPALVLSQKRFLYDQDPDQKVRDRTLWKIPLRIKSAVASSPFNTLLEDRKAVVHLPDRNNTRRSWIVVNAGRTGVYRVNYSPEIWQRFHSAIESRELPTAERLGLESDAFAVMRAGYILASDFLSLAQAYVNELEYPVWIDLVTNLGWINNLAAHERYGREFRAFARNLFCPIVTKMGWQPKRGESHLDALLRGIVIQELGHYGEKAILREAKSRFERFLEDAKAVRPDLRSAVLNLAAYAGDGTTYEALRAVDRRATLQEEKVRVHTALTYFTQPELLQKVLELSLSPEVRSQDTISLVAGVGTNPQGGDLAWEFVKAHWGEFDRRYGKGGFLLMRLIESVTSHFATADKEKEVAEFFHIHPVPSAQRTVQQSLERIRINTRWLIRNRKSLGRTLRTVAAKIE